MNTKFGAKLCDTTGCLTNVKESQALCTKCTINSLHTRIKELETSLSGRTYCHSDEAVEAENKRLREALIDISEGNGDDCTDCQYNIKRVEQALNTKLQPGEPDPRD